MGISANRRRMFMILFDGCWWIGRGKIEGEVWVWEQLSEVGVVEFIVIFLKEVDADMIMSIYCPCDFRSVVMGIMI